MQNPSDSLQDSNSSSNLKAPQRRFTPEERRAILERYHAKNPTEKQTEFIAREGISKASLSKWLTQERRAKGKRGQVQFQEVLLKSPGASWQLEIVSPQNWTVRLSAAPAVLAEVLRALPC